MLTAIDPIARCESECHPPRLYSGIGKSFTDVANPWRTHPNLLTFSSHACNTLCLGQSCGQKTKCNCASSCFSCLQINMFFIVLSRQTWIVVHFGDIPLRIMPLELLLFTCEIKHDTFAYSSILVPYLWWFVISLSEQLGVSSPL